MKSNEIIAEFTLKNNTEITVDDIKNAVSSGADAVCLYDVSDNDKSHEENIHLIKSMCEAVNVPVYAGKVKTFEDVKKYLYAGCKGVIVDASGSLLKESIKRFGGSDEIHHAESLDSPKLTFSDLKTNSDGLVPCIVQDENDGTVLMMAYMNEESFNKTLETGRMTYFSRSRNKLWEKGEESGHTQFVKSLTADCDFDTLLAKVKQIGVACHTGSRSCFFNDIIAENTTSENNVLNEVYSIILDRKENPKEGSYTNYLFDKGIDKVLKKVGEEASEVIIAAKNPEREEIIYEISDLIYHLSVMMAIRDVTWDEILKELKNR